MTELVTLGETMAVFTPTENEPLRYVSNFRMRIAGAESNLAVGLAKLGHAAGWISRLGDDEFGRFILNGVRAEGVDVSGVRFDSEHRTGIMFKEFCFNHETKVHYYRNDSAASHMSPEDLDCAQIENAKILHLTGITPVLSEECLQTVKAAIKTARNAHVSVSFDPNIRLKLWNGHDYSSVIKEMLLQADIVSCGVGEAEILFKTRDVDEIFRILLESGSAKWIIVKDGARGAFVGNKTEMHPIPPTKWSRLDSVGAGDAFNAGFIAGILENRTLEVCGKMGSIMGGLATQTAGDTEGLPTREEMDHYLNNSEIIYR